MQRFSFQILALLFYSAGSALFVYYVVTARLLSSKRAVTT